MDLDSYVAKEAISEELDWAAGTRTNNWRNYVGENVRAIWRSFSDEQKAAIALDADELASMENWD